MTMLTENKILYYLKHEVIDYKNLTVKELKQLRKLVWTLTSKMPCPSLSISAFLCRVGDKLSKIKDSVCYFCYARRGFYHMPNVKTKHQQMLEFMKSKYFVDVMVQLNSELSFFRWFDSGDIQSLDMANDILDICERTPNCKYWIPTKEYKDWKTVLKSRSLPSNVALRFSTPMNDTPPLDKAPLTTTVFTSEDSLGAVGVKCGASYKDKYECGDCRACWDTNINNVAYAKH